MNRVVPAQEPREHIGDVVRQALGHLVTVSIVRPAERDGGRYGLEAERRNEAHEVQQRAYWVALRGRHDQGQRNAGVTRARPKTSAV